MKVLFLVGPMLLLSAAGAVAAELIACLPDSWSGWVTLAVTVCAAVSAVWSRPADDAGVAVRILYAVVNAVGFNAGKAQNADDASAKARKIRA